MAPNITYDYTIAKDVLSANDKDRLVCIFLNSIACTDGKTIDWETAAKAFESKSADSMRVCFRGVLAKIEKAGGKVGEDGVLVKGSGDGAKKRKGGDGDDGLGTPKPKKARGRPKKAAAEAAHGDDGGDDAEGGMHIKDEEDGI